MNTEDTEDTEDTKDAEAVELVYDKDEINRDIAAGQKAYRELMNNASLDWTHWYAAILGLRGLRTLAFDKAGTANMRSQAFRDAMSALLTLRKHVVYDQMERGDRSACYKLMDRLEDINDWYVSLSNPEKLRWKHPETVAKHCPKEFLAGGMKKHNQPKKAAKKKPAVSAETERLKALLIQIIQRLAKYEPDALKLLDQVYPADPDDAIDDVFVGPEESAVAAE